SKTMTSSPGRTKAAMAVKIACVAPAVTVTSDSTSKRGPYSVATLSTMAWRSSGSPAIGGYWLRPASMWRCMASNSTGSAWKSGKPCDRFTAPHSAARRDITVKMVVPISGKRESMRIGVCMTWTSAKEGPILRHCRKIDKSPQRELLELGGHALQMLEAVEQLGQIGHATTQFIDVGQAAGDLGLFARGGGGHRLDLPGGLFALGDQLIDPEHRLIGDLADPRNRLHGFLNAGGRRLGLVLGRLGQLAHLVGHHREAPSGLAGPRRLDRRIERQQIGLIGNRADPAGDRTDRFREPFEIVQPAAQTGLRVLGKLGRG